MSDLKVAGNANSHHNSKNLEYFTNLLDVDIAHLGMEFLTAYAKVDANHAALSYTDTNPALLDIIPRLLVFKFGSVKCIEDIISSDQFHIALSLTRIRRWLKTFHPELITDVALYGCQDTPAGKRAVELGLDVEEHSGQDSGSLYILVHKDTGNRISIGGPYLNPISAYWSLSLRIPWSVSGQFSVVEDTTVDTVL